MMEYNSYELPSVATLTGNPDSSVACSENGTGTRRVAKAAGD
jgi:hypothetical protein